AFQARMKALNPELYIVGEIWSDPTRWMSDGVFDGVMNYPVYYAIRDFFLLRVIDATQFCDRMTRYLALTPESWKNGMFQFCSTHDIPRILWFAKGNRTAVLNCYQMAAMLPGGISVYYGDELLLTGGYDPDNRRCMPWYRMKQEPFAAELFARIRQAKGGVIQSLRPINADLVEVQLIGGRMTICMSR
ncbi:MAG: alpha-amylase family glycosyl hydrolase, partial [Clostridiaceae bacterium]